MNIERNWRNDMNLSCNNKIVEKNIWTTERLKRAIHSRITRMCIEPILLIRSGYILSIILTRQLSNRQNVSLNTYQQRLFTQYRRPRYRSLSSHCDSDFFYYYYLPYTAMFRALSRTIPTLRTAVSLRYFASQVEDYFLL